MLLQLLDMCISLSLVAHIGISSKLLELHIQLSLCSYFGAGGDYRNSIYAFTDRLGEGRDAARGSFQSPGLQHMTGNTGVYNDLPYGLLFVRLQGRLSPHPSMAVMQCTHSTSAAAWAQASIRVCCLAKRLLL